MPFCHCRFESVDFFIILSNVRMKRKQQRKKSCSSLAQFFPDDWPWIKMHFGCSFFCVLFIRPLSLFLCLSFDNIIHLSLYRTTYVYICLGVYWLNVNVYLCVYVFCGFDMMTMKRRTDNDKAGNHYYDKLQQPTNHQNQNEQ